MTLDSLLRLLSPHVRSLPRFSALAAAVFQQAVDLASVVQSLPAAFSVENAVGKQLDIIGESVGAPRPSPDTSDTDYRQFLLGKLALWRWDGTNETVPEVLSAALPGVTWNDPCNLSVTFSTGPEALLPVPAGICCIAASGG